MTTVAIWKRKTIFAGILNWVSGFQLERLERGANLTARLNAAFQIFIQTHGEWVDLGFNEDFFGCRVLPLIELYGRYGQLPTAYDIALAWDEEYGAGEPRYRRERVKQLTDDLALFISALKLAIS